MVSIIKDKNEKKMSLNEVDKKRFSALTYIRAILVLVLYFFGFGYSIYSLIQKIQSKKDLMNPLTSLLFFVVIAVYIAFGRKGKPNPMDKKIGAPAIIALIVFFFAVVWFLYWFGTN